MEYVPLTDEQKKEANSVDLVEFLEKHGEHLIRSGRDMRLKSDPSITVRGNRWYDHSAEHGGLAVRFVQEFYDLSYPEAVLKLLNSSCEIICPKANEANALKKKPFVLPEANDSMRRVFAYLTKQRFLQQNIISQFVQEKKLYEDKKYHNAVFVGFDENGVARHAQKRSSYSKGKSYRANVEGSDPRYSFHHLGNDDTIYAFEAPIDMLSFITLHPRDWQKHSYVALCGVSEHALLHQLKQNSNLNHVILCLDHDAAGIEAEYRLTEILKQNGYTEISVLQSEYKDWNEVLKAGSGVSPLPAQEHPKLQILPEVCAELYKSCEKPNLSNSSQNPLQILLTEYAKLKPLLVYGNTSQSNVEMHLQNIAAVSLLEIQHDRKLTMESLLKELQSSYMPHQDRGKLHTKLDDFQHDFSYFQKQLYIKDCHSKEDNPNIIQFYQRLTLDCVRMLIFLKLNKSMLGQQPNKAVCSMMKML